MRRLLAFLDSMLGRAPLVIDRTTARLGRLRFVTIKPTRGNSSPSWCSTLATILLGFVQLPAWYEKLL
jgi:hypothetical protein